MRGLTRFELVAVVIGLLGGSLIGLLWLVAPGTLAALPDASDLAVLVRRTVLGCELMASSAVSFSARNAAWVGVGAFLFFAFVFRPLLRLLSRRD